MADFKIKQGDTDPPIEATLQTDGTAFDLSGLSVSFVVGSTRAEPIVDASASIEGDGSNGEVSYQWQNGDTDVPGVYKSEFVVDDGGDERTFPDEDYITVKITREVQRNG